MEAPWQGASIHPLFICAVGAATGWLGGFFMGSAGRIVRIEEMLVGIFGAFIGGDFLLSQLVGPTASGTIVQSLGLAVAGAVVLLVMLRLMRGAVGPLKSKKSRARRY